jgi:thioredoxin-like negative regulator of GroEL
MPKGKKYKTGTQDAPRQTPLQWLCAERLPLATCGVAFLIYSRSLFCGFEGDDFPQIVNNPQVQSWAYLPKLLGSNLWSQLSDRPGQFYRPIFSVWMLLVHTCGGLAPWFWHLSSILLHVAATWLVFWICRRLTENDAGAAAGAAIFAVQPIHVDAVSWVSASCELLFSISALAAMLALLGPPLQDTDADTNKDKKNGRAEDGRDNLLGPRVWLSAMWFGAGLFAKETGVTMLAILPAIAWIQLKERIAGSQRLWRAAFPYGVVTAGYLAVRWAVMRRVRVATVEHSWATVVFSAPSILLFYLKKLFFPGNLAGTYTNPLTASPTTLFWLQLSALVVGAAVIAWLAIRYRSLFGLAAALIVIPMLPALAVTRIYQQGTMTNDRYLYLPSAGASLLVALIVQKLIVQKVWSLARPAKVMAIVVVSLVFMTFSVITIFHQKYYQDDIAFYSHVIEVSPSDAFAMGELGNVYLDQGHPDLALEQFQRASQIVPDDQKVKSYLARGLFAAGKYSEAETVLKDLLQSPQLTPAWRESMLLWLVNVEISLGNLTAAQQLLEQAEHSDDRFPQLHWMWGMLYQRQDLLPQAQAEYEKEFEITGDEQARQRAAFVDRLIQSRSAGRSSTGQPTNQPSTEIGSR